MAAVVKLLTEIDGMVDDVYDRRNAADKSREAEYNAVVSIQSWFRGQRCRSYLSFLGKSATTVQKAWRGYIGRRYYRQLVKSKVFIMKLNHYNAMAVKIQKVWRGYYTRKYISNYYSRKRYLEGLKLKNEIVRAELTEYAEQQEEMKKWKEEDEEKKKLQEYAKKRHYLLSTEVIPGIYNSPYWPYPAEMEFHLRNVRPETPVKKKEGVIYDPTPTRYDIPKPCPLPPIEKKPQGPFRDPREVQKQRYKPFQPSLRVATNFASVEEAREAMKRDEWIKRINDNIFVPFTKKEKSYDPLLHTKSQFGHLPYGTKYFREENIDQHVVIKDFQTVLPPVPIFQKLNDTYSQGQV